ncbi:hypothetical protein MMC28_002197 [Mycoblastus sanguinarius]|nr:hypothetical protein [Mycoblastus sanguinarius]
MSTKKVCLRQHTRTPPLVRTKYLDLSLDEHVLKYYICPRSPSDEADDVFDLFDNDHQLPECAAIIRQANPIPCLNLGLTPLPDTQDGFACLEALKPNVFVPALGCGFDGSSTHAGINVRVSAPVSVLQLRPGESFHVGGISLCLLPEEHSNIHNSSGPSNYENYHEQVGQMERSSIQSYTPNSRKQGRLDPTIFETPTPPKRRNPADPTPIMKHLTETAMAGKEDSQAWTRSPRRRGVLQLVNAVNRRGNTRSLPKERKDGREMSKAAAKYLDLEEIDNTGTSRIPPDLPEVASGQPTAPSNHEIDAPGSARRRGDPLLDADKAPPSSLPQAHRLDTTHAFPPDAMSPTKSKPPTSDFQPALLAPSHISHAKLDPQNTPPNRKKPKLMASSPHAATEESQDSMKSSIQVAASASIADTKAWSTTTDNSVLKSPSLSILVESRPFPSDTPIAVSPSHSTEPSPRIPSSRRTLSKSSSHSIEPTSSMRSTRSAIREELSSLSFVDVDIRILFASSTSVGDSKQFIKFLSKQGVKKVHFVTECTVLCIGQEELKKTSKLILAVLLGKEIINEDFVRDSVRAEKLQDITSYVARDPQREAEWGISLDEAINRGRQGLNKVLLDLTVIFTSAAKKELGKGFSDMKEIVMTAGARGVSSSLPKKSPEASPATLVIAVSDDGDLPALEKGGWKSYVKEIITLSVLRGVLDLNNNEFLVSKMTAQAKTDTKATSKKRKR